MDDYYDFEKSFNYKLNKMKFTTIPSSSVLLGQRKSKIIFKFSFQFDVSEWIISEDDESRLVSQSNDPVVDYLVFVSFDQLFSSFEETQRYMEQKLKRLMHQVDSDDIRGLAGNALKEASEDIKKYCSNSTGRAHEVLKLHFNVLLKHEYIYLENYNVVPTVDYSSNGVLKRVAAAEYSRRNILDMNCAICLEKFSGDYCDGDREAILMSMPCSHIFHGDCIKTWLRTSHCCPLCRFDCRPIS